MARPDWIEVGWVRGAHGVRGEVRIVSSSDNPERFIPGAGVYARLVSAASEDPRERRLLRIEAVRGMGASPIVAFSGIESRVEAEVLRGAVLEVPAAELPELEEGEYYPFDLAGLEARVTAGERVGVVREVLSSPAHDLLLLELDEGGDVLVPFVEEAVPVVDLGAGFLSVIERFLLPAARGQKGSRQEKAP